MGRFKDPIRQLFLALTVCTLQVRIITKMLWQKVTSVFTRYKLTLNPLFPIHDRFFFASFLSVYMYIGKGPRWAWGRVSSDFLSGESSYTLITSHKKAKYQVNLRFRPLSPSKILWLNTGCIFWFLNHMGFVISAEKNSIFRAPCNSCCRPNWPTFDLEILVLQISL